MDGCFAECGAYDAANSWTLRLIKRHNSRERTGRRRGGMGGAVDGESGGRRRADEGREVAGAEGVEVVSGGETALCGDFELRERAGRGGSIWHV